MNSLEKLETFPLRERNYQKLQDTIISGQLAPGKGLFDQDLTERGLA